MYGGTNGSASTNKEQAQTNETNSNIKIQLENWYRTNIREKGLDEYVADSIYCNDRSIPGKSETGWSYDTGLGFGSNYTAYGAVAREGWPDTINYNTPKPTLICPNKNDVFTKEDKRKGNGALSEKVGLITADEIVAAGSGKYGTANKNYYLYKGNWYWSLSPNYFSGASSDVFRVNTDGNLNDYGVAGEGGVSPVISLIPDYVSQMIGNGTIGNEYRVE